MSDLNEKSADIPRTNVLGVGVSSVNMEEAVAALLDARAKGRTGYVCVTGVHGVIESQRDPGLRNVHNQSFLTVPDGMPTVWMGREQGFAKMGRVYGPDLMLRLCEASANADACSLMVDEEEPPAPGHPPQAESLCNSSYLYPSQDECGTLHLGDQVVPLSTNNHQPTTRKKFFTHFLYGSTPDVLEKLKANLERKFPGIRIVGTYSPPFRPLNEEEERELQNMASVCKPDFFWVGLSTPKQEKFMAQHDPRLADSGSGVRGPGFEPHPLDAGIMLGVGAAFDIHAGLLKDAPEWIKNSGLQWFYRLCQEPRRLWRRYLDIVPKFLWLAFLQLLGMKKYAIEDAGASR